MTKLALDGTELGTFSVGNNPTAMAFDGENLWIANSGEFRMRQLDPKPRLIGEPGTGTPRPIEVEPASKGEGEPGTVTKLARDGTVVGTFTVGVEPGALTFDGQNTWVVNLLGSPGNVKGDHLAKLALDGTVLGTFTLRNGIFFPAAALAFDGGSIWVAPDAAGGGSLLIKLALDGTELGRFRIGVSRNALAFDGKNIWLAQLDIIAAAKGKIVPGTITKFAADGRELGRFPVEQFPIDLAFDGESLWVANSTALPQLRGKDETVSRLALDGTELGTFSVGLNPVALAFDGESIWVANFGDNTVSKLSILEQ